MKIGKLSEAILTRSILKEIHEKNDKVLEGAGIGRDAAVIRSNGEMVVSTAAVTIGEGLWSKIGINRVINDIVCQGGEPTAVMLNITMPQRFSEKHLKEIMRQAEGVCREHRIQIAGGHSEVSEMVKKPIISVTGMGDKVYNIQGTIKATDKIIITKWIGMEAAFIMANLQCEKLCNRFPKQMVDILSNMGRGLSVREEACVAAKHGAKYMRNLSNGGVFAALWELSSMSKRGLIVDLKKIPVRQEIIEACELFDLNPYKILSGGSLMIVADEDSDLDVILENHGIMTTVIGTITDNNDKIIVNEDEVRYLDTTGQDELLKILE